MNRARELMRRTLPKVARIERRSPARPVTVSMLALRSRRVVAGTMAGFGFRRRFSSRDPFIVFASLHRIGEYCIRGVDDLYDPNRFCAVLVTVRMVLLAQRLVRGPDHLWWRIASHLEVVVMRVYVCHR